MKPSEQAITRIRSLAQWYRDQAEQEIQAGCDPRYSVIRAEENDNCARIVEECFREEKVTA